MSPGREVFQMDRLDFDKDVRDDIRKYRIDRSTIRRGFAAKLGHSKFKNDWKTRYLVMKETGELFYFKGDLSFGTPESSQYTKSGTEPIPRIKLSETKPAGMIHLVPYPDRYAPLFAQMTQLRETKRGGAKTGEQGDENDDDESIYSTGIVADNILSTQVDEELDTGPKTPLDMTPDFMPPSTPRSQTESTSSHRDLRKFISGKSAANTPTKGQVTATSQYGDTESNSHVSSDSDNPQSASESNNSSETSQPRLSDPGLVNNTDESGKVNHDFSFDDEENDVVISRAPVLDETEQRSLAVSVLKSSVILRHEKEIQYKKDPEAIHICRHLVYGSGEKARQNVISLEMHSGREYLFSFPGPEPLNGWFSAMQRCQHEGAAIKQQKRRRI